MRKKQKEHAESGSIGAKIFRYAIMAIVLFISALSDFVGVDFFFQRKARWFGIAGKMGV